MSIRRANKRESRCALTIVAHAQSLLDQLRAAVGDIPQAGADRRLAIAGLKAGVIVELETIPPAEGSRAKATKVPSTLEFPTQDAVVLRSTRNEDRTKSAVLFIPDDARAFLKGRIADYGRRDLGNQRRPDVERLEIVETIRAAAAESLFVGAVDFADGQALGGSFGCASPAGPLQ